MRSADGVSAIVAALLGSGITHNTGLNCMAHFAGLHRACLQTCKPAPDSCCLAAPPATACVTTCGSPPVAAAVVGALFPLALTSSSSSSLGPKGALSLPDRFFLGGVENGLRGFAPRGVEPAGARARRPAGDAASGVSSMARTPTAADGGVYDALGADLFANVMAALRVKLPGAPGELGMHLQVFVNGGSAALWGASALARAAGGSSSSEGGATSPAPGAASSSAGGWRGTLAGSARDLLNTFRWTAGGSSNCVTDVLVPRKGF